MTSDEGDFSGCYDLAEELVNCFFKFVELHQEETERERKQILSNCQHCYTIRDLKQFLKNSLGGFVRESRKRLRKQNL